MDSSNSDTEDFEGFVVSPEEKESYKVWARKRRTSEALDSDSDDDVSGDDDDDDDEEEEENAFGDEGEELEDEESEGFFDPIFDDTNIQDSGDEIPDQCPVCLMSLKEQLLGTPNNCPHVFCFECIQEWAKNATTCPVGRKPFNEILVHATKKGPVLRRIPVEERLAGNDDEEEDDPTYCEVCGECNREDRMLLCDGCDNGYHMECLTPAVEYVPLEEWFCPACASRVNDQEEQQEEEHRVREAPRARATRGRPRGSTARRVSGSDRTVTTRTARTVASARGRGRIGRGRRRRRSSSRGRGRGGRRSSTRGRSSSRKRKFKGRKKSKRKTSKTTKKRRIAEEDEVSPFIYEPQRRGKTVHARLLESLNSTGRSTEPARSATIGRMPFPSRVEPSCSFSLFGNAYALYDFDEREENSQVTTHKEDEKTPRSAASSNPDVLASIFQGLDTLHSSSAQLSRDGKLIVAVGQSCVQGSSSAYSKSTEEQMTSTCEDKVKDVSTLKEDTRVEAEHEHSLASSGSKNQDVGEEPSHHDDNIESISISKPDCRTFYRKVTSERRSQETPPSSTSSNCSILSKNPSSNSTLSGFRIPKRRSSCDKEEKSKTSTTSDIGAVDTKQDVTLGSYFSLSKFRIPKRSKSAPSGDNSNQDSYRVNTNPKNVQHRIGGRLTTSPTGATELKRLPPKIVSQANVVSRDSCSTDVRPLKRENFQQKNPSNFSSSAPETITKNVSIVSKVSSIPHSYIAEARSSIPRVSASTVGATGPCMATSNNVTSRHRTEIFSLAHSVTSSTASLGALDRTISNRNATGVTKRRSNILHCPVTSSNSVTPLSRVTPLTENLKVTGGKEQRRSNIEIIRLLHEKQRCMREQMSDDLKPVESSKSQLLGCSGQADSKSKPREGLSFKPNAIPTCSRGVNLPVAVVKPSLQTSSALETEANFTPSSVSERSPVKSIASRIIDFHSFNTEELKKVRKASNEYSSRDKALVQELDGRQAEASRDRDQQRKLGIARLQRQQQIVDEVKLALKPFFRRGEITKDGYKLIMKKSVEKIKESNSSVDRDRVGRLVKKYIKKIKGVNF